MKKFMNKLTAVLLAVICMACLSACGSSDVDISAVDSSTQTYMEQQMNTILSSLDSLSDEELNSYMQADNAFTVAAATNYEAVKDELGAYKGVESTKVELEDKTYTVTSVATYEQRTCTVTLEVTPDTENSTITPESITFDPKYTLGETLIKAALNTVMGVGIVFIILIFLSFLISLFKYIGKASGENKNVTSAPSAARAPVAAAAPVIEDDVTDDLELVAVIAAAIAAAENTSTDSFVVRSIKKVNKKNWRKA